MKKAMLFLLAMVTCAQFAWAKEIKNEKIITNYGAGEFAVKGEVRQAADELVAEISKVFDSGLHSLSILVEGSADMKGIPGQNDWLGAERAKQMALYLESRLAGGDSAVETKAWSTGSEADARQVKVIWTVADKIVPILQPQVIERIQVIQVPAVSRPGPWWQDRWLMFGIFSFSSLMLLALIRLIIFGRSVSKEKDAEEETSSNVETISRSLTFDFNGESYIYITVKKPEGWACHVPSGEIKFRQNWQDVRKSLKSSLKNPEFRDLLMERGALRISNESQTAVGQ